MKFYKHFKMIRPNSRARVPRPFLIIFLVFAIMLGGCAPGGSAAILEITESPVEKTPFLPPPHVEVTRRATATSVTETSTPQPDELPEATPTFEPPTLTPTPTVYASPTPDTRPLPEAWRSWPVVPVVSERARQIYQQGLLNGSQPDVFSIIGDCQSEPPVFMGIYASNRYSLGDRYQFLQGTIDQFAGNYDRIHVTVKNGLSVASVFSPLWADRTLCNPGETPLECEFRLRRPSIVFINMGTNWKNSDGFSHDIWMRQIVDYVIAQGALPILSTKADNQEGDHSINLSIARVAYEYDIPLWNFWLSVQDLPDRGLDENREDKNYLTIEAWDRRSFTGLLTLDRVWRFVTGQQPNS